MVQQKGLAVSSGALKTGVMANNTAPIVTPDTTSGFFYIVWRMIPFNLTQVGNNPGTNTVVRNAITFFGLFATVPGGGSPPAPPKGYGIGFELVETDSVSSAMMLGTEPQRQTVGIVINAPMTSTTPNCYFDNGPSGGNFLGEAFTSGCTTGHPAIIYSNPNSPIDLNAIHLFTMQLSLRTDGNSWAAFSVDQNAWYNVTQAACTCIEASGHSYKNMWPYMTAEYCMGVTSNSCVTASAPNQSLGTMVDYVLVDNFVPGTLPVGQPLTAPSSQLTSRGLASTFPNYLVFLAFQIGNAVPNPDNSHFLLSPVYFGGLILTLLVICLFSGTAMAFKVRKGMVHELIVFITVLAGFIMGILPIWVFAPVIIIAIAILTRTIKSTWSGLGDGGEVE